jgi:hypothetical protein
MTGAGTTVQGAAELYMNGKNVGGSIEASVMAPMDVFNTVEGTIDGDQMKLNWRNPYEGSIGTMMLRRRQKTMEGHWRKEGFWRSVGGPVEGAISFVESDKPLSVGNLRAGVERQAAWQKGMRMIDGATAHMQKNNTDEASGMYKRAADQFQQAGDKKWYAKALLGQAQMQIRLENYSAAERLYAQVLELGLNDKELRGLAQNGKGDAQLQQGQYEKARQSYADTLDLGLSEDSFARQAAERGLKMVNVFILNVPPSDVSHD